MIDSGLPQDSGTPGPTGTLGRLVIRSQSGYGGVAILDESLNRLPIFDQGISHFSVGADFVAAEISDQIHVTSPSLRSPVLGSPFTPCANPGTHVADPVNHRLFVECTGSSGMVEIAVFNTAVSPWQPQAGSPYTTGVEFIVENMDVDTATGRLLFTTRTGLVVFNVTASSLTQMGSTITLQDPSFDEHFPADVYVDSMRRRVFVFGDIRGFGGGIRVPIYVVSLDTLTPLPQSPLVLNGRETFAPIVFGAALHPTRGDMYIMSSVPSDTKLAHIREDLVVEDCGGCSLSEDLGFGGIAIDPTRNRLYLSEKDGSLSPDAPHNEQLRVFNISSGSSITLEQMVLGPQQRMEQLAVF